MTRTVVNLHRVVCQNPDAGPVVWNDYCTCGHYGSRHGALTHDPVPVPTGTCHGRNLAGPCLWDRCTCSGFTTAGVVYLLHFSRPYRHAAHYTGWTGNLTARLHEHANGRGARLLAVVKAAGITWELARTWPGTRATERALKRQGGASRRCPLCGVTPATSTGGAQ